MLADDWRAWLVENLLAGVEPDRLRAQLLARGVPRAVARRELAALGAPPVLAVARQLAARNRRLELALALSRAHALGEPDATTVERRATPDAEEFYRRYWAAHRPVILTDLTRDWPARRWTPAWFREHFGRTRVEIGAANTRMTMARFLDRVTADGCSTDDYMVSNNRTMRRGAFRALLDDLRPPAALFWPPTGSATSLWIGPAGTHTPLHHDTTGILFCQVEGRKRVELVAPHESALLAGITDGFYSAIDIDRLAEATHPALQRVLVKRTVLAPGDALFIPAGWWHQVTALDISISVSLLGFRRPNDFDWYRPGSI